VLGELMASQLLSFIHRDIVKRESYAGNSDVGMYLLQKIFEPGARWSWNEVVRYATGQELSPANFVRQFVSAPA